MFLLGDDHYTKEHLSYKYRKKSNLIYLAVLLFLLSSAVALPFIQTEVSSQSRGIVRSLQENIPVLTVVSGKLNALHIQNNIQVQKKDTLLVVAQNQLKTQNTYNASIRGDLYAQLHDLKKLAQGSGSGLKTAQFQKEYTTLTQSLNEIKVRIQQDTRAYNRAKHLFGEGVIPKADYEKALFAYQASQSALQSAREAQLKVWAVQRTEVQQQIKNLSSNIAQVQEEVKNYVVTAPQAGTIVSYTGVQKGSFVQAGQKIAEISTEDSLIVECTVSPNDIGLIKVGQAINFQIDAYNYNQWGFAKGEVIDIDRNTTLDPTPNKLTLK